jgi:hypothetical protein
MKNLKGTYHFENCTFFGVKWLRNDANGNGVYEMCFSDGYNCQFARFKSQDVMQLKMYDKFYCNFTYKGKYKTMYVFNVVKKEVQYHV